MLSACVVTRFSAFAHIDAFAPRIWAIHNRSIVALLLEYGENTKYS